MSHLHSGKVACRHRESPCFMVDTNKTAVRDWWNLRSCMIKQKMTKMWRSQPDLLKEMFTRKLAPKKHHCHQRTGKHGFGSGGRLNQKKLRSWEKKHQQIQSAQQKKSKRVNFEPPPPNKKTQTKSLYRFWAFSASTWGRVEKSREVCSIPFRIVMRQPWEKQPVQRYVSNGWWKRCKVVH